MPTFTKLLMFQTLLWLSTSANQQWNVVLIVADDLGYGDLSCYGSTDIKTPNLDRLASEGVRFSEFYSNAPECTPTRTALLTGRYQQRVGGLECAIGLDNVGRYDDAIRLADAGQLGLPADASVIPRAFKENGYKTAMIGKWHLGDGIEFSPNQHGFDLFIGPTGGAVDYFHHTEPIGIFMGIPIAGERDFYRNEQDFNRRGDYLTELISNEAAKWLSGMDSVKDRFFLYLPYTAPHGPYQGPDDWREQQLTTDEWSEGSRETYISMVEALDEGIGKVLSALRQNNMEERTLVIFVSDNGPAKYGDAGNLRGNKGKLFEGGIKVPCIVRWPGRIPEGYVSRQVSITMDLTASLIETLNPERTDGPELDGFDILNHLTEENPDVSRRLSWRKRRGSVTWKATRDGCFKYVYMEDSEKQVVEEYLFDLSRDPREQNDLSASQPERLSKLKRQLAKWEQQVAPQR